MKALAPNKKYLCSSLSPSGRKAPSVLTTYGTNRTTTSYKKIW